MTVYELDRDQLTELKKSYWCEMNPDDEPDMYTLANIDEFVDDEDVFSWYEGVDFVPSDFLSSAAGNSEYSLELGDCLGDRDTIVRELRQIADAIEKGYYSGVANYGTSWSIM